MFIDAIIEKLPDFDVRWPPEVQGKWLDAYRAVTELAGVPGLDPILIPEKLPAAAKVRPPAKPASGGKVKKPSFIRMQELFKNGSRVAQVYKQIEREFPNPDDQYSINSLSTHLAKLTGKGLIRDKQRSVRPASFYQNMKIAGYSLYQQGKTVLDVFLALDGLFGEEAPPRPDIIRKWFEDWENGKKEPGPNQEVRPRGIQFPKARDRAHELIDQGIKPQQIHKALIAEFGELAPKSAACVYYWRDKRKKLESEKVFIGIDCAPGDGPTMVIAKKGEKEGSIEVLNVIQPESEESAKSRVKYDSLEDSGTVESAADPIFHEDQPHYFSEVMKLRCLILMKGKKHWNEVLEVIKQEFPNEARYPTTELVNKWYLRWPNRGFLKKEEGPVTTPGDPKGKPRVVAPTITDAEVEAMGRVQRRLVFETSSRVSTSRDWSEIESAGLNKGTPCNRDGLPVCTLAVCLDYQYQWRVKDRSLPAKILCCRRCPNHIATEGEIKELISRFGSYSKILAATTEDPEEEKTGIGRPSHGGDRTNLTRKLGVK